MKKFALLTVLIVVSIFINAQNDTLKGQDGDWGFGFNITGLINNISVANPQDVNNNNAIFAKHYLTDQNALRLTLGIKTINNKWTTEDSVGQALVNVDSTEKRMDISFALGYERHLGNFKRLDPYLGAEIAVGIIGKYKVNANTTITDATGVSTIQRVIQQDGGTSFGINLITGFNYFIVKKLALGAEYGLGYTTSVMGGDVSESVVNTPASGAATSEFTKGVNQLNSSGVNVNSTFGIILSYYF
jgi:hypothetical protein